MILNLNEYNFSLAPMNVVSIEFKSFLSLEKKYCYSTTYIFSDERVDYDFLLKIYHLRRNTQEKINILIAALNSIIFVFSENFTDKLTLATITLAMVEEILNITFKNLNQIQFLRKIRKFFISYLFSHDNHSDFNTFEKMERFFLNMPEYLRDLRYYTLYSLTVTKNVRYIKMILKYFYIRNKNILPLNFLKKYKDYLNEEEIYLLEHNIKPK